MAPDKLCTVRGYPYLGMSPLVEPKMNNQEHDPQAELLTRLDELKGRLEAAWSNENRLLWSGGMRSALEEFDSLWRRRVAQNHHEVFSRIRTEDTGLIRRVEQLREKDNEILKQLEDLKRQSEWLVKQTQEAEFHGDELTPAVTELKREGLAFVKTVRAHHDEITHWFLEAFHRDRGIVD
jgi:hypothetical protein